MTGPAVDPAESWAHLMRGNARFTAGAQMHPRSRPERRLALLGSQREPRAAVLGCCDSRVPPELVFDQGLGDIFTVRSAGTVLDDVVLGSLEFAVSVLRVPLVVVLGHDGCGAIGIAREVARGEATASGHLAAIVAGIAPAAAAAPPGEAAEVQAVAVVDAIVAQCPPIAAAVAARRVAVIGATYSLETGEVREVSPRP